MTQEGKDKIITRAIHFIATNTNDKSYRIGQAIIAELDLVKKLTLTDDAPSNCVETDNFRVYLPKDDENVVIIEDYFQEKKTIDIVDFNNLMSVLFSVQDY
jgi:hypothetical protein